MRRRDVMGLIGSMLALTGCWGGNSWHQKMTVTVNTPKGEVSGSAVTSVWLQFAEDTWLAPGYAYQGGYSGEAVAVEVRPGKFLFAVMDGRLQTLALKVFVGPATGANPKKADANRVEAIREARPLDPEDYPLLVTFTDINDPKTVKQVKHNNLSDAFGAGYSLKAITLEITDDAVTEGKVEKVLEWVNTQQGALVPSEMKPASEYKQEEELGSYNFIRKG